MRKESIQNILVVTVLLSLCCALIVSTAAVTLRPIQEENKQNDAYRSILHVAGLYDPNQSVQQQFEENIEVRVLHLDSGKFMEMEFEGHTSLDTQAQPLARHQDIARIKQRPEFTKVYLARNAGRLDKIILPVYGYGLWSTMYAFVALEKDGRTVYGLKFYEHGETPGLGGEIDNPHWLKQWAGKQIYNEQGKPSLEVMKGHVLMDDPKAKYRIDGLSGASLTSKGVEHLIRFWTGGLAYQKFLYRVQAGEIS